MSEPRRLLTADGGELEQEMLRAWLGREPSDEARAKTLAMAGLGVGAVVTAAGAVGKAAGGGSVAPKAIAAGTALLKWLAVGAIGVTAAGGAIGYAVHASRSIASPPAPAVHAATPAPARAPAARPPANAAPAVPAPLAEAPLPVAPPAARPLAAAPAKALVHSPAHRSTLDDEVSTIAAARQAVAAGDGRAALDLVDAYDARYPEGSLAQESAELRIEALVRLGDHGSAERLAARFVAAHPTSPYVRRIRALLATHP